MDSPNRIKPSAFRKLGGIPKHNGWEINCLGIYPDTCSSASLHMSAAFRRVYTKSFFDSHREPTAWFPNQPTNHPTNERPPSLSLIPFNCRCDSRFEIHLRFSLSIDTRLPFSRPCKCMVWVIRSFRTVYTSLDLALCYHHATTHSLLRIESEYQVRFQSYRHGCWSDLFERSGVKI